LSNLTPAEQREFEALLKETEQSNQAFKARLVQLLEKKKGKTSNENNRTQ